jgi:hypothetical protein
LRLEQLIVEEIVALIPEIENNSVDFAVVFHGDADVEILGGSRLSA